MYCRVPHFVVEICLSLAPTSIIAEYPSGKLPTTRVRRRISFMIRSRPLFVRNLLQCSYGKSIYVNVSSTLFFIKFTIRSSFIACNFLITSTTFCRAASLSSWAWIALSIATTSWRCFLGHIVKAFRYQWTMQRCHLASGKKSPMISYNPGIYPKRSASLLWGLVLSSNAGNYSRIPYLPGCLQQRQEFHGILHRSLQPRPEQKRSEPLRPNFASDEVLSFTNH